MIKMFIKKFLVICDFSKFNLGSSFSECVIFSCLWNLLGIFCYWYFIFDGFGIGEECL